MTGSARKTGSKLKKVITAKNEKLNFFSTLKYDFFQAFPVTGQVSNYPQYTQQTLSYNILKPFDDNSNLWPVKWASVFGYLKKGT